MAAGEVVSLTLTAVFGLVSSVGVIYQLIDIRRRSHGDSLAAVTARTPEPRGRVPQYWSTATAPVPTFPHSDGPVVSDVEQVTPPLAGSFGPQPPISVPRHTPAVIVRVRQLMLVLSILTVAAVGLLMYIAVTTDPAEGQQVYSPTMNALIGTIVTLIIASPLAVVQTILSVKIGARRNWARIAALVLMLGQAGLCTCIGGITASAGLTPADDGFVGASSSANLMIGITWTIFGAVAIAASAMLLTQKSNEYFSLHDAKLQ